MLTIHLRELRFFSFHGLFEEEKKTGNEFEVNLSVEIDELPTGDDITNTVDYVRLFELVNKEMKIRRNLLESVAESIVSGILDMSSSVRSVSLEIWKLNPAIEQFQGKVGITLSRTNNSK